MKNQSEVAKVLCADCHTNPSDLEVRRRCLCNECFRRYVNSKIMKRMESYRFKHQVGNSKRRLFLPLSGGVSSLVLLQILDTQVKRQLAQQGRTAYDLVIGHINLIETNDTDARPDDRVSWFAQTMTIFDSHQYLPAQQLDTVVSEDALLENDLEALGVSRRAEESNREFVSRVLRSPKSVTSRTDLCEILQHRLVIALAKKNECESIIWGHSDSRLAAKALAEVAKGRGAGVPNGLSDGVTASGLVFNYPLRDLFKSELELYLQSLSEDIHKCIAERETSKAPPVSVRNTSIDDLLSTYITSQGEKYPSIMANVVKTASKLQVPTPGQYTPCRLCALPITTGDDDSVLCYGCNRMKKDIKT